MLQRNFIRPLLLFACLFTLHSSLLLGSYRLETCYGPLEIEEPVLVELLECAPMQRLKGVYQYGVLTCITHPEQYTRWDHSVGVFALLRMNHAPLDEQIAGLLHDVSHTAFSHFGDYFFQGDALGDAYQDNIHDWFVEKSGVSAILERHGFTVEEVSPKSPRFQMLEQDLPSVCGDRLDYNLQGAFWRGWLTKAEASEMARRIAFVNGHWVFEATADARLLGDFSLHMTTSCWGAPFNELANDWLGAAISRMLDLGNLDLNDIHFGEDMELWACLMSCQDAEVCQWMRCLNEIGDHYEPVEPGAEDKLVKAKFRGIDPLVLTPEGVKRLTEVDEEYRLQFEDVKALMARGWPIKIRLNEPAPTY